MRKNERRHHKEFSQKFAIQKVLYEYSVKKILPSARIELATSGLLNS